MVSKTNPHFFNIINITNPSHMDQPKKKKLTEDMTAYHRAYRQKHHIKLQKQSRDYRENNKESLKKRRKAKRLRIHHEPDLVARQALIDKVERQRGWVDVVDCFRIIDVFVDIYGDSGINIDAFTEEDQVIYMYDKIKNYNSYTTNVCNKCSIEKPITEFYKRLNTYTNICKICIKNDIDDEKREKRRLYAIKWREKNGKEYYEQNKEIILKRQKRNKTKNKSTDDPTLSIKNDLGDT
jgi:hypothetical protein